MEQGIPECSVKEKIWRLFGFPSPNVKYLDAINEMRPSLVNLILNVNYGDNLGNAIQRLAKDRADKAKTDEEIAVVIGQMNRASIWAVIEDDDQSAKVKSQSDKEEILCAGVDEESDNESDFVEKTDAKCDPYVGNDRCIIIEERVTEVVTRTIRLKLQ